MDMNKDSVPKKLAASFRELVKKSSVEKITIKEITDGAGLIRPTFYHHFKDKYDLIEWIWYQDVIEPARFFWEAGMIPETEKLVFAQILKEKEYYTRILKVEGQNSFKEIVIHSLEEVLLDYISESASGIPEEIGVTPSRIAGYYANSFYYILDSWIRKGMSYSAQQMADIYPLIPWKMSFTGRKYKKKGSRMFVRLPFFDIATKHTICSRNRMHDAILS